MGKSRRRIAAEKAAKSLVRPATALSAPATARAGRTKRKRRVEKHEELLKKLRKPAEEAEIEKKGRAFVTMSVLGTQLPGMDEVEELVREAAVKETKQAAAARKRDKGAQVRAFAAALTSSSYQSNPFASIRAAVEREAADDAE